VHNQCHSSLDKEPEVFHITPKTEFILNVTQDENICFRSGNPFPFPYSQPYCFHTWFGLWGFLGGGHDTAVRGFSKKAKELNSPNNNLPVVGMITVVTENPSLCSHAHASTEAIGAQVSYITLQYPS